MSATTTAAQTRSTIQGMIAATGFVQPNGDLQAISFRFLHGMFQAIQQLEGQVATLQAAVQTLQAREPS
jgi:hypothetical protein